MSVQTVQEKHPSALEPGVLTMNVLLSFFGAIIGLQIITSLGVTPNTAIIGVLISLIVSRIPIGAFMKFKDMHRQNLVQTAISSATFGAANSLLLPIAIPYLLGHAELVWPMLMGAVLGMSIDMCMLYWLFDSKAFPGKAAWRQVSQLLRPLRQEIKAESRQCFLCGALVPALSALSSRFLCQHLESP